MKRRAGYEAISPESTAALKALEHHGKAELEFIRRAGRHGTTRPDVQDAIRDSSDRRIAELRNAGLIKHKTKSGKVVTRGGCAVIVAVPDFERTYDDARFAPLYREWAELIERHKHALQIAWELKDEALNVMCRIHRRLRKLRRAGRL